MGFLGPKTTTESSTEIKTTETRINLPPISRQNVIPSSSSNTVASVPPAQTPSTPTTPTTTPTTTCKAGKLSSLSNYKGSEGKYKSVTSGDYIYYAGYQQMTKDDQDAFAIKADKQGNVCWNKRLTGGGSKSTPDEKCTGGVALLKENGKEFIYLACTTDGGSYTGFIPPASPVPFQKSYGNGGGPAASYIAKLDGATGAQVAGTYLRGTLSSGKTNTIKITSIKVDSKKVELVGETAWGAPTPSGVKCKGGSYNATLSLNLSTLLTAKCGGGEQTL